MRGYFGIGVFNPKTSENIGTLWRHANNFGADFIFTVGRRYKRQPSDTAETYRHIPLYNYADLDDFKKHIPHGCQVIGVELDKSAVKLPDFTHPERCIYLLGAEDHGLTKSAVEITHGLIEIPTCVPQSMNVAVSGTLVMYDRFLKSVQ